MIITYTCLPTKCEFCGSDLEFDGIDIVCKNPDCKNKRTEKIKALVLNLAPVDGLGFKTIEKIMTTDIFYEYNNYNFTCLKDILKASLIPGVTTGNGERGLFNKMLNKIQTDTFSVSQFLLSLNIPGLGKIGAKNIENSDKAKDIILDIAKGNNATEAITASLLQDKNLTALLYNIHSEYNKYFIEIYNDIKDRLKFSDSSSPINKGQVAVTGKLSVKRSDFEELLNKIGFKLTNSINKDTVYLITDNPNSDTEKNKKADKLGITKITEADFRVEYNV